MDATVEKHKVIRDLFEKGAARMMEEAQVPQHVHLKIVSALIAKLKEHESKDKERDTLMESYRQELERYKEMARGEDGKDGVDADENRVAQAVLGKIRMPKDGKNADEVKIVNAVLARIPLPKDGVSPEIDLDALADKVRPTITLKDIDGLEERLTSMQLAGQQRRNGFNFNGKFYRFEELMSGAGGSGGTAFAGSQEKSTTVPNGVLTTFTFTHTPTLIYWNGAFQTLTDDYTVSGKTITFTTSAGIPQTGDKITNVFA
jgi:hypothetical protein